MDCCWHEIFPALCGGTLNDLRKGFAMKMSLSICTTSLLMLTCPGFAKEREAVPPVQYGKLKDTRNGITYKTVVIGGQTWMAENLEFATNGGSKCPGQLIDCEKFGRIYESEVISGACPYGWKIPSLDDFKTLWKAVNFDVSDMLDSSAGGRNSSGFSLLRFPGCGGDLNWPWQNYNQSADHNIFWTTDEKETRHRNDGETETYHMTIAAGIPNESYALKGFASIRCIKIKN